MASAYDRVQQKHKKTWVWPITIDPFEVKKKKDIFTYRVEWDQYPLEEYYATQPYFENINMFQHVTRREFLPNSVIEDHWLNRVNDYEVIIRDYCRMGLTLVEKEIKGENQPYHS